MRTQVAYRGAIYVEAGGVGKYTVHDSVSAWKFAQSKINAGKVVALDLSKGKDTFPMYFGPTLKDIIAFHLRGGGSRKSEDLRQILTESDLTASWGSSHVVAGAKRVCDVCGKPIAKWKGHQYHLAGIRITLCRGMSPAKQQAYAKMSAKRIQSAKAQARSLGFKTDDEVETYLRGLGFGSSTLGSTQGETNMKSAGYKGEKVPMAPKGPQISPKLTAPPFAKKDNHAPVAPVRKAVPSVAVKGKK